MKRLLFLGLLGLNLLLSGCSDEYRLERKEDRLLGAWTFEKAFFRGNNALFRDDVLHQFEGDIIEFYGDYTAIYDDFSLGELFDGEWELFLERDIGDDEPDVDFFLDMTFYDPVAEDIFSFAGDVTNLTYNRMTYQAYTRDGVYTFKFRRP